MKLHLTTLLFLALASWNLGAQEQIYNMNFDRWHKDSGTWYPYPEKATAQQKVWDTANKGLSLIRSNTTFPEYSHLAPGRTNGAAARIQSRSLFGVFVAGNLFTGVFQKVSGMSGAVLTFGTPFKGRPTSLSGWYHYQPGTIDYAKKPLQSKKGEKDEGLIDIALMSWEGPSTIDSAKEKFVEGRKNPDCVGYGTLYLKKDTGGYVYFELPIVYKSDNTPSYVVICVSPSRFGEYFTGSSDSVLYVDEWKFNY